MSFCSDGSTRTMTRNATESLLYAREVGLETKIAERQKDWDMQARNTDEKQAELFHTQWNLIREQMSTFSKELISVRTDLSKFKEEVNTCFGEADFARESGDDALRIQYEELCMKLERETKERTTECSEMKKEFRAALDVAANQQAVLERSVLNLTDELRQTESRLRADIDAEPRTRQDEIDRLRAELQQAITRTSGDIDKTNRKLETSLQDLLETVRRENMERVSHMQEQITFNSEEIVRVTRDYKQIMEKEIQERRSSHGALTMQIENLQGLLKNQRVELENMLASLRTQLADLKQELNSQNPEQGIRELRAMIEAEAKKRAEDDGIGAANLSRLQAQLETESRERARILPDVTEKLKLLSDAIEAEVSKRAARISEVDNSLRLLLEQEGKTRAADRVHSDEELNRLRAELDAEVRARQDAIARASIELHEALKPLTDAINREIQERQAGDEEAVRLALQAKQACEKEAHDRALDHSKTMDTLKDLLRSLDQEKADREKSDSVLRTQITETRQELEAEKSERRDEDTALSRAIRSVETVTASGLKDLRAALDVENGERKEETKTLMQTMSRLQTQVEAESRELARIQSELSERMRALSDALGLEATERKEADAEIERAFRDLSAAFDQEARQRAQAFQAVQDAIKAEVLERGAGDEAAAKNLKSATENMERLIEKLREALWAKMVSLTDRFVSFGREWRETPPGADIFSQTSSGTAALRDERSPRRRLESTAHNQTIFAISSS